MSIRHTWTISEDDLDKRLDVFLARQLPELSRSMCQDLIREQKISFFSARKDQDISDQISNHLKLELNDVVSVNGEYTKKEAAVDVSMENAEPIFMKDLYIVYEDSDLVVIDKPVGCLVHPGNGQRGTIEKPTLLNGLAYYFQQQDKTIIPLLVHRLDQDTSGLMVVAKNQATHYFLTQQFTNRTLSRHYIAFIWGCPENPQDTIETWIMPNPKDPTRQKILPLDKNMVHVYAEKKIEAPSRHAKKATTQYQVLNFDKNTGVSALMLKLQTGRTHQIRAHMNFINHSILGDPVYNNKQSKNLSKKFNFQTQCLHAFCLSFVHPKDNKTIKFKAACPYFWDQEQYKKLYPVDFSW